MKSSLRRIYKVLFLFTLFLGLGLFQPNEQPQAAWNNNALDFYNTHGEANAKLINGTFWFCQRGVTASSSTKYRPIGFEVRAQVSSGVYGFSTNIGGSYIKSVSQVKSGSYTYDLWSMDYHVAVNRISEKFPNVDFGDLLNKEVSSRWRFDAYVTVVYGSSPAGSITNNGDTSGLVYHDGNNKPYSWIPQNEWDALFFQVTIPGSSKGLPTLTSSAIYSVTLPSGKYYETKDSSGRPLTFIQPGETIGLRFDSRLSSAVNKYFMNATFWDSTDYDGNDAGTIAQWSNGSGSNNTWKWYIDGSFRSNVSSVVATRYKHSNILVTTDTYLAFNKDNQYYTFYPRVMTFYNNNYSTSNFQVRYDSDNRQDSTKKYTVVTDGTAPTHTSHEIKNISPTGFDVYVYGVTDKDSSKVPDSGVKSIKIPVWTKNDQSDIVWYEASNQGNGTYKVTISASKHGNSKGPYKVHMHAYDNVNNLRVSVLDEKVSLDFNVSADVTVSDYEYYDTKTGKIWVQNNNKFSVKGIYSGQPGTGNKIGLVVISSYELNGTTPKTYSPIDYVLSSVSKTGTKYYVGKYGNGGQQVSAFNFDTKTSYVLKNSDTSYSSHADVWFTADKDYEFNALTRIENSSGGVVAQTGYRDQKILVSSDGDAPTATSSSATYSTANDTVALKVNGVKDSRSGLDTSTVIAKIYPKGQSSKSVTVKMTGTTNFTVTPKLSDLKFTTYGDYVVDFYATDNVGNQGKIGTGSFVRQDPTPTAQYAIIYDYDYLDKSTNIKWVKAGEEFRIEQAGSGVSMLPTDLYSYLELKSTSGNKLTLRGTKTLYSIVKDTDSGFKKTQEKFATNTSKYTNGLLMNFYLKADAKLNNNVYVLSHLARTIYNGSNYDSALKKTTEYLGIDAVAPTISYVQSGRDEITVTVKDAESGLKKANVSTTSQPSVDYTVSGTTSTFKVTLNDSNSTTITVTDNVGNKNSITIGNITTKVVSTITTEEVTENKRKKLKVTVTAQVTNPIKDRTLTLQILGTGDGVPATNGLVKELYAVNSNKLTYSFYVDDVYNVTTKPTLSIASGDSSATLNIASLADLNKNYSFTLQSKYDSIESSWTKEASKSVSFCSKYNHFKYTLERLSDDEFNKLSSPVKLFSNVKNTSRKVDLTYLQSGDYKAYVTMYDYNGNPSGEAVLEFRHNQPSKYSELGLNVTAVKDISWENATYPFVYNTDKSKFPLGDSYLFNNNPIKVGYAINYNIDIPSHLKLGTTLSRYYVYGKDSAGNQVNLNLYSDGKTLTSLDESENTTYLTQDSDFVTENSKIYGKHYLPANLVAKTTSGTEYTGKIYVDLKFTADLASATNGDDVTYGRISGRYNLYAVTLDSSALDDINIDKQR